MSKTQKIVSIAAAIAVGAMLVGPLAFAKNDEGRFEHKGQYEKEARSLGSTVELHIFDDGKVLVRGAKVTALTGAGFSAAFTSGSYVLNGIVTTDGSTEIIRKYGGKGTLADFSVGDVVSVQGTIVSNQGQPTVLARTIKNWSVQKKNATFSGAVTSVDGANMKFVLATKERGNQTVSVASSTKIMKNGAPAAFADLTVNQMVAVKGLWDNALNTVVADEVRISVEKQKMTLEGTVKTVPATSTAPTSFVLTSGGTDYTVNVASDTAVIGNSWGRVSLGAILAGHKVRVYGAVSATAVDATVVRDVNL